MIVIWNVENNDNTMQLYSLEVKDDDFNDLLQNISNVGYPFSQRGEYLFIENDKVVNHLDIYNK
jgi:hypothetical protein